MLGKHGTVPPSASTVELFLGLRRLPHRPQTFTDYNPGGNSTYSWVPLLLQPLGSKAYRGNAYIFFQVTSGCLQASNRLQKLQPSSKHHIPLPGSEFKARAWNRSAHFQTRCSDHTHFNFSSVRVPRSEESC